MKISAREAWVTTAVSAADARNALVLCFSLRTSLTTRKLLVIASPTLSEELRDALQYAFDCVYFLEDRKPECLTLADFAKLSTIGVCHEFEKYIYLLPNSVAMKNADELFDDDHLHDAGDRLLTLTNFMMKPSLKDYKLFLSELRQRGKADQTPFELGPWLKERSTELLQIPLCNNFYEVVDQNYLSKRELKMSIMNLPRDIEIGFRNNSLGLLEQAAVARWMHIFHTHVEPMLKNTSCSAFSKMPKQWEGNEPIAVVGMSGRLPKCENIHQFWNLLLSGEDGTGSPPSFRWKENERSKSFPDDKINAGFLPCPVDEFDAKFFGISPKEAALMDPQHRILLEVVWEALEDACIDPFSLCETAGSVFMGSWVHDYKHILEHSGHYENVRVYFGNAIDAATARISNSLKLTGPSVATEGGCAASMIAVHLACNALRLGQTNIALAAGVNLLVNPFGNGWMPMVTSEDGHCKTFCEKADGFARAEGCCVLALKRLSDAVRDGDNIWALIKGMGTSQEGTGNCLGTPTILGESLAMRRALQDAGVNPEDVSFVETHGTGTPVGDQVEIAAIAKAYHTEKRKDPLIIGSAKTNVGHTESCSGITGIIKTILAMHHGVIPPHINFEKLNPAIDLEAIPATIALRSMEWPTRDSMPKRAGVSSFGLSGVDAHVILEEPPQPNCEQYFAQFERQTCILKVSAKSNEALGDLLDRTKEYVTADNSSTLQDICYSGNVGRADFNFRAAITAKSKKELVDKIQQKRFMKGEVPSSRGKVCFLFSGQGSQYPGMAKQLYETCPTFRMHFDYCENILRSSYNIDLRNVIWDKGSTQLNRTLYSQTSIFIVEYALLMLLDSWGVRPDYVLGHSLGEYAAAVCAGILRVEDAIKLIAERVILVDKLPEGKMLVIRADKEQVALLLQNYSTKARDSSIIEVAAVNSLEQTVIAGDSADVLGFAEFCKNNNFKCTLLGATHAFHSRHMDPLLTAHWDAVNKLKRPLQPGSCNFISSIRGTLLENSEVNHEYWTRHARDAVCFLEASREAFKLGCRIFVEIGPQPILCNLIQQNSEDTNPLCLPLLKKSEEDWTCLLQTLGALYLQGIPVNWNGLENFYNRKKVRSLPHYPFQRKKFWAEKLIDIGNSIHPLLGTPFKNASSTKLFQSFIQLSSHKYLQDHVVGKHVIFPGTGYLEMCLRAGIETVSSSDSSSKIFHPVKVENLRIKVPLQLTNSKRAQLQTVLDTGKLSTEFASNLQIRIYERAYLESSESTWRLHAAATFSQTPFLSDTSVPSDIFIQVKNLEKCVGSCELADQFYEYLASTGLQLGSSFRSIQKIWTGEDEKSSFVKIRIPSQTRNQYVVHPVAMDAMLQTYYLLKFIRKEKFKLLLPVKIGSFVWFGNKSPFEECLLYTYPGSTDDGDDSCTTLLLTEDGKKIIAKMSGIECAQTTLKQLEGVLEEKVNSTPGIWEEVWRPSLGHMQHRIDMDLSNGNHSYDESFVQKIWERFGHPDETSVATFFSLSKLSYYNILRALYGCGLQLPEIGCSISRRNIIESLQLQNGFEGLIGSYLEILVEEGVLKKHLNDQNHYTVTGILPQLEKIVETLCSKELTTDLTNKFLSTPLLHELGKNLGDILKNRKSALPILFPEGENQYVPMTTFYREYDGLFGLPDLISEVLLKWLGNVQASQMKDPHGKVVLRILEIGGGTGSFTSCLIKVLDNLGIQFEYTFTDVSCAFFAAAQARFQKWTKSMRFMKFNIEEDPLKQGLIPEYFDYICGENVIHATKNIRTSLSNVALLLRCGGRLDFVEMLDRNTITTYLFGVLDGFWRFEDTELRPEHCLISVDKWKWVLELEGLEMVAEFSCAKMSNFSFICSRKVAVPKVLNELGLVSSAPIWLLFHQEDSPLSNFLLENFTAKTRRQLKIVTHGETFNVGRDCITTRISFDQDFPKLLRSIVESGSCLEGILYCWTLNRTASSQEEILQPYFYLAKSLFALGLETGTRLLSFFNGVAAVEGHSLGNIHQSTVWGFARSLSSEHPDFDCRCIDVGESEPTSMGMMPSFHEIWNLPGKKGSTHIAFGGDIRYEPKLQPFRDYPRPLEIPPVTSRFRLQLPDTRAIEDLHIVPLEGSSIGENEVEVQVKATALNFKDVLIVLQATPELKNNGFAVDIAGVIKRVGSNVTKWSHGDSVFCCNPKNSRLHSHAILHEDDVFAMDSTMSWSDAATLPAVFLTTYLGLVEAAKIGSGDNVLIHTASGGVGQCALQLCKMVGANVICTAGSNRKRNYLRSLGIQHIFDSRSANYGKNILEVTGGHGVDVVLNSLTGEGFKEETLMCCASGARFVEMSKLNVWTRDEVRELRPDVKYTTIDVLPMKSSHRQRILKVLTELLRGGKINPLVYVSFDLVNIREALKYLQQAKHIGKIVCIMPEHINEESVMGTQIFHDRATYLITGGRVGGIGFAVCKWMVEKGAKYILLATRSLPTEKARKEISQLNSEYSAKVTPVQLDIGDYSQCQEILENRIVEMGYPALRGVMHCAGALNDGLVQNQDWEGFSIPLRAKVKGTLNLHELTKDKNLEHFVVFSSMMGLLGPSGQSNHCAANNFEDVFAHYRHSLGLPVTTINWGHWADVGVGTEIEIPGLKQFSEKQGIAGLELALKSHRTQIAICNFDPPSLLVRVPHAAAYLDEKIWKQRLDTEIAGHSSATTPTASDDFWREMDLADSFPLKLEIIKTNVTKLLRNILKVDESEEIGDHQNFQDIGVDSLMYLEIVNAVKTLLGRRAPVKTNTLRKFHSVAALSAEIHSLISNSTSTETYVIEKT